MGNKIASHPCARESCSVQTGNVKYCSTECRRLFHEEARNTRIKPSNRFCIECKENPLPKFAIKFCSKSCQALHQHDSVNNVRLWLAGELDATKSAGKGKCGLASWARNHLLEEAKWRCSICEWNTPHPTTGKPPLEIDHIDGNRCNNDRSNLRVLCPNCHSLTPTFRRYNYKNVQALKNEFHDFK